MAKAKAEKKRNIEKKQKMLAQAEADWKTIDQLTHNLNSQFMDYEDKWRQVLGSNLYKDMASNLGVDSSMNSKIAMNTVKMPITAE